MIMFAPMDLQNLKKIPADRILSYILMAAFFSMPLGTSWNGIFGGLAALVWIASGMAWQNRNLYLSAAWCRPVLFLILLPWVCLIWSVDAADMGISFAEKSYYWLYGLALASLTYRRFSPDHLIKALLAGLTVNFCWAAVQMAGLFPYGITGPTGFGRGYSTLATYLIVGMLMASYYFSREKG